MRAFETICRRYKIAPTPQGLYRMMREAISSGSKGALLFLEACLEMEHFEQTRKGDKA